MDRSFDPSEFKHARPRSRDLTGETFAANAEFFNHELVGPRNGNFNRIRLLKLEPLEQIMDPIDGHYTEPILGRLEEHQLDSLPSYTALSYAWGPTTDCSFIRVDLSGSSQAPVTVNDTGRFYVTRTLEQALHELLKATKSLQPIHVWVDAICINQGNFRERSFQVQLMSEIYSRAFEVCIWLGMSNRENVCGPRGDCVSLTSVLGTTINISREDLPRQSSSTESCWWNRLWVVQEVYFAQSCPIILRWSSRFTWDDFLLAWHELEGDEPTPALAAFDQLYNFQSEYEDDPEKRLRLGDLLHWTSGLQSSVAHDTIYAVLGMARMDDRDSIVPDYQASVVELYGNVTRRLLESSRKSSALDLFAFFPRYPNPGSASWIRDFSRSCNRAHILFQSKSVYNVNDMPYRPTWDQHIISKTTYTETLTGHFNALDNRTFTVHGEEIATVRKSCAISRSINSLSSLLVSTQVDWEDLEQSFCDSMGEREAVLNLTSKLDRDAGNAYDPCTLFITYSGQAGICYSSSLEGGNEVAGRLEKGDKIVILRGASMPFVLRPIDALHSFLILGPCRLSSESCKCRSVAMHSCLTRFIIE